jgi:hypothetical protein
LACCEATQSSDRSVAPPSAPREQTVDRGEAPGGRGRSPPATPQPSSTQSAEVHAPSASRRRESPNRRRRPLGSQLVAAVRCAVAHTDHARDGTIVASRDDSLQTLELLLTYLLANR